MTVQRFKAMTSAEEALAGEADFAALPLDTPVRGEDALTIIGK